MKTNFKNFQNLNEGFFSNLKSKFINKWEKLAKIPVRLNYMSSGIFSKTQTGKISGSIYIYVERNKNKVKAEVDMGFHIEERDIYDIYSELPNLENVVSWALSTDKNVPLRDLIKEKYGRYIITY